MDPELKRVLEEIIAISRENNKILRRMQNTARWGRAFRVFYWVIIIGSMLGAYYYFQPFIQVIAKQYELGSSFFSQLQQEGTSLNEVLNSLGSSTKTK
jgi:hypothetical protein